MRMGVKRIEAGSGLMRLRTTSVSVSESGGWGKIGLLLRLGVGLITFGWPIIPLPVGIPKNRRIEAYAAPLARTSRGRSLVERGPVERMDGTLGWRVAGNETFMFKV